MATCYTINVNLQMHPSSAAASVKILFIYLLNDSLTMTALHNQVIEECECLICKCSQVSDKENKAMGSPKC